MAKKTVPIYQKELNKMVLLLEKMEDLLKSMDETLGKMETGE